MLDDSNGGAEAGRVTVFDLHNRRYDASDPREHVAALRAPSAFLADHHRMRLSLGCVDLPPIVDPGRIRASRSDPRFVAFVNPTIEKGFSHSPGSRIG